MPKFSNYLSLVKFSHTVFAMPFALIGFFLGVKHLGHSPDWLLLVKVVLCMVFARTAAMAFNRFTDKEIDALNARTRTREIPSGKISSANALMLVVISASLFIVTTYFINPICLALSPVALAVVLFYSYTKRFTWLCHLVLGLGLSLAPIGAYLAVTGQFDWLPLIYSFIVFTWVSGFDVIYALQDQGFDMQNELHSIPADFGINKALRISAFIHVVSALSALLAACFNPLGWLNWTGTVLFILLLNRQHRLVKADDLSQVDAAFFTTNGLASVLYAVCVIADGYFFR